MNKINVLQMAGFSLGGTEKVMQTLTEYLDKSVFDVSACAMSGGIREEYLKAKGIQTYVINNNQDELVHLMKEKQIHVVHIHRCGSAQPFEIEAANKAGVPVIVETNVFGMVDSSEDERLIDMHLLVSKNAALNYAMNAGISMVNFLKKGRVLYNPIDVDKIEKCRPTEQELDQFRYSIKVTKDTPLIGRVGRPDINKWTIFSVEMLYT